MHGPCPNSLYPMPGFPRVVFLRNAISVPNIEVGEYTYYDDPGGAERWEERNVIYHYEHTGDRLRIGRFVMLAHGSRFIMSGANHLMSGFSTYPFSNFGGGWEEGFDLDEWKQVARGDTVVHADVWIGNNATVMPGVTIGAGAIIGANAVVAKDVPPYAIVVGNPGKVVKYRFHEATIARLLAISWWDWPAEKLTMNLAAVRGGDLEALEAAAAA